jgi:hypothetical protein
MHHFHMRLQAMQQLKAEAPAYQLMTNEQLNLIGSLHISRDIHNKYYHDQSL